MTSSEAIELANRYEFLIPFLPEGFIPYIPEFDKGVDFILYREDKVNPENDIMLKIQQKSRWTVDRNYMGRNIWIAFPDFDLGKKIWYLAPHDKMVRHALDEPRMNKEKSSWQNGSYSKPRLPNDWRMLYHGYQVSELLELIRGGNSLFFLLEGSAKREAWSTP